MKINKYYMRLIVGFITVFLLIFYGFSFILEEGSYAVITRFGAPRAVIKEAGIHTKYPWPFEQVHTFDARKQYFDSSYLESLTKDKKNVILQTYVIWAVDDPLFFLQSTGSTAAAMMSLDTLVISAKNAVLGNYDLSALVSTDHDELKLADIQDTIFSEVQEIALNRYGIRVHQVGFKKLGLPEANIWQVFDQMRAERLKYVAQLEAEGKRDASIIRNEAEVRVAEIIAEGTNQAAIIRGETEAEVAKIYAEAYTQDPGFYSFLRKLESLERLFGADDTIIFNMDEPPFDVLRSPQ